MACSKAIFDVRPCRLGDVSQVSRLLKASWHAAYDPILGKRAALQRGKVVYSPVNLAMWIAQSRFSSHAMKMLVAIQADMAVGLAMAQIDAPEIVLNMLYVAPERKGQRIGSALLEAVIGSFAEAKAIRAQVLKDNVAAIAWYEAQGFEIYGETRNATGLSGVAALYMDKKLDRLTQRP